MRSIPINSHRESAPGQLRGSSGQSRPTGVILSAAAVVIVVLTASLSNPQTLAGVLMTAGLALVVMLRTRPLAALAVVVFLAIASRPTFEIASVNIRVEQPAVVFLAVHALIRERPLVRALFRQYAVPIAGLVVWLVAAAVSSALFAPDLVASLRIVIWLALSMVAGGVAGVLAAREGDAGRVAHALVVVGIVHVGISLTAALTGRVLGVEWGGYGWTGVSYGFRASGLAWEANIFASAMATLIPFGVAGLVRSGSLREVGLVALLSLAVWVALTRTVFVSLALGLGLMVVLFAIRDRDYARIWAQRLGVAAIALIVGLGAGGLVTAASSTVSRGLLATRTEIGIEGRLPALPTSTPGPIATPSLSPTPGPTPSTGPTPTPPPPIPIDMGDPGNLEARLVRVRQALQDIQQSPILGLGANSFGQRHADPSQAFRADYLGMLPFTVLYDSGIVGLAGFALFGLGSLLHLWRWRVPFFASAFLAALAIMFASYVMTDALRLAFSWIVIGTALGLAHRAQASAGAGDSQGRSD